MVSGHTAAQLQPVGAIEIDAFTVRLARAAGEVLLQHFGQVQRVTIKEDQSSVVTEADVASERLLIESVRRQYPGHGILAEESGFCRGDAEWLWVIDPLDGTSNFAAGLPWFGVLLAVLRRDGEVYRPELGVMHLPVTGSVYVARAGRGATRDGGPVQLASEPDPRQVLCAFGLDAAAEPEQARRDVERLLRLSQGVRNVRATNSLVDFCYTLDGRLGGCVNLNCKIWDIAAAVLLFAEAGGRMTDLEGRELAFRLDAEPFDRSYAVVGASAVLHPKLQRLVAGPV